MRWVFFVCQKITQILYNLHKYIFGGLRMKRVSLLLLVSIMAIGLVACSGDDKEKESKANDEPVQEEKDKEEPVEKEEVEEPEQKEEPQEKENIIDTSMYKAENVDVTDALEANNHITIMIDVNEELTPGMAFQNILNETYYFLEQDIVKKADTVGINIMQNESKIAMFTVKPKEFQTDDDTPMAELVLKASEVEMTSPEVEEYANTMGLPLE